MTNSTVAQLQAEISTLRKFQKRLTDYMLQVDEKLRNEHLEFIEYQKAIKLEQKTFHLWRDQHREYFESGQMEKEVWDEAHAKYAFRVGVLIERRDIEQAEYEKAQAEHLKHEARLSLNAKNLTAKEEELIELQAAANAGGGSGGPATPSGGVDSFGETLPHPHEARFMSMAEIQEVALTRFGPSAEQIDKRVVTAKGCPDGMPGMELVHWKDVGCLPEWLWTGNVHRGNGPDIGQVGPELLCENIGLARNPANADKILRWFQRCYNLKFGTARYMDIVGLIEAVQQPDGSVHYDQEPDEHGLYWNVVEGSLVEDFRAANLGGHAYYIPARPFNYAQYPPDTVDFYQDPHHTLRRAGIVNTDMNASRSASAIQWFDPGSPKHPANIIVQDVWQMQQWEMERADGGWKWYEPGKGVGYSLRRAPGMLCHHTYQVDQQIERHGIRGAVTEELTLDRVVFARGFSRYPFSVIRGLKKLTIKESYFRGTGGEDTIFVDDLSEILESIGGGIEEIVIENAFSDNVGMVLEHRNDRREMSFHCPGAGLRYTRGAKKFQPYGG